MASTKARLTYTDSRGLAEKIRIMLCVAEIPFEDNTLKERSQFLKVVERGDLLFDQIPLLEYNGLKMVQGGAIMRYLAAKKSMYGKNPEEQVRIDMLYEGSRDWHVSLMLYGFSGTQVEALEKGRKAMDKYCPVYEKELANNKSGFLVGDSMTLADVGMFEAVLEIEEHFGPEALNKYPNIQAFMTKMKSDKRIQNFLQNHRFPPFTPERVKEIKAMHLMD